MCTHGEPSGRAHWVVHSGHVGLNESLQTLQTQRARIKAEFDHLTAVDADAPKEVLCVLYPEQIQLAV